MAKAKTVDGKTTQKEMVRNALQANGWDAKSVEMQTYIKEHFDTELSANVISNYKSIIKRESGKSGGKRGGKGSVQLTDLETVCGLVNRLGADQVKKLVDMAGMFS